MWSCSCSLKKTFFIEFSERMAVMSRASLFLIVAFFFRNSRTVSSGDANGDGDGCAHSDYNNEINHDGFPSLDNLYEIVELRPVPEVLQSFV
jgi:hypothetical protein